MVHRRLLAEIKRNRTERGVTGAVVNKVDVTRVDKVTNNDQRMVNVWCVADYSANKRRVEAENT